MQDERSGLLQVLRAVLAQPGTELRSLRLDVAVGEGVDTHPTYLPVNSEGRFCKNAVTPSR